MNLFELFLIYKADMWALGVCLYTMLTTKFAFVVPKRGPLDQLLRDEERANCKLPKGIDNDADHLIHRLLQPDCDKTIEMFGVVGHLWLKEQTSITTN